MRITEEDFYGDDWYGDDFSGSIGDIMDALGNLAGLLLVRDDASGEMIYIERSLTGANNGCNLGNQ